MILCHKCSGTFTATESLYGCSCISGYPRGFEKELTFEQASVEQFKRIVQRVILFTFQKREPSEFSSEIQRLQLIAKKCPALECGVVDWKMLARES